ncbi:hypothetical protein I3F58_17865 [Streptomyces sp. MUM 203J]|uniref:hypothetical protein n=1 Tax=Streptomyces sp. MUM 203J TaxID=2791990 RepID=UPI001F03AD55|nr:hypothetical protein [Streptomyces sp. MUM 203J]MCH0541393.1 hypothetical protein [Streptomyces sp. MUM 203J]
MSTKSACGPDRDPEFFGELDELFARYPEAADRYVVVCLRLETEVLKIDFSRQVGVSRVDGGRIVTEFHDRDERDSLPADRRRPCCAWKPSAGCITECDDDPVFEGRSSR